MIKRGQPNPYLSQFYKDLTPICVQKRLRRRLNDYVKHITYSRIR